MNNSDGVVYTVAAALADVMACVMATNRWHFGVLVSAIGRVSCWDNLFGGAFWPGFWIAALFR